jgi:hypothetical protein
VPSPNEGDPHACPDRELSGRQSDPAVHDPVTLNEVNHFAAWQEPDLFTTEIRAAFRSLR